MNDPRDRIPLWLDCDPGISFVLSIIDHRREREEKRERERETEILRLFLTCTF
jgi:hypothetical protein